MDQPGVTDPMRSGTLRAQELRQLLQAGPALSSLPGAPTSLLCDLARCSLSLSP